MQDKGAAFLLGLPTLTCLGYGVYQSLRRQTLVLAIEAGNPQDFHLHYDTQLNYKKKPAFIHFSIPKQTKKHLKLKKEFQTMVIMLFLKRSHVVMSVVVCADELLEQADYLYSCAETEKLYQLMLQYKDR